MRARPTPRGSLHLMLPARHCRPPPPRRRGQAPPQPLRPRGAAAAGGRHTDLAVAEDLVGG